MAKDSVHVSDKIGMELGCAFCGQRVKAGTVHVCPGNIADTVSKLFRRDQNEGNKQE